MYLHWVIVEESLGPKDITVDIALEKGFVISYP